MYASLATTPSATDRAPITLACIDMAGTTVSDGGIVIEAFRAALAALGVADGEPLDRAMARAHDTMGWAKTTVFADILGDQGAAERAVGLFSTFIFDSIGQGRVTEMPGARDLFAAARDAGVKVALTTGFTAEVQHGVIDHLGWGTLVDFAVAPGTTLRGRPWPDMVLSAALRAQVDDVRQVAVVGDTGNDLWSGYRAGASLIAGVLTGSHTRSELELAPHTHVLNTISDLAPLLRPAAGPRH